MQWQTGESEFVFVAHNGSTEVVAALPADADIGEVFRVFRGFLIAAGFSPENVDLYLTPE